MAAFTATDWAVTVQDEWIEGAKRHTRCLLSATVGSTTSGGSAGAVPAPTYEQLGMRRNVEYIILSHDLLVTDGSRVVGYNQADHTIKVYTTTVSTVGLGELASGTAVTGTLYVEAVGW